jgi:adenosylcobinamide-GDP ribazoletransferase
MGRELRFVLTAVQFLTRLPTPSQTRFEVTWLPSALRYFPLVGALIGGFLVGVCALARLVLPMPIAVGLALGATLLLTGALHEDGLADTLDGFGGGKDDESILTIMRDSRIGAFGALGLLIVTGLKWATLSLLPVSVFFDLVVAAHLWSRFCAIGLIWMLPYARSDASKSSPFAGGWHATQWLLSGLIGLLGLLVLKYLLSGSLPAIGMLWIPALVALLLMWAAARYCRRRIAGFTGDCLGAVQQITELSFLLGGLALAARGEALR